MGSLEFSHQLHCVVSLPTDLISLKLLLTNEPCAFSTCFGKQHTKITISRRVVQHGSIVHRPEESISVRSISCTNVFGRAEALMDRSLRGLAPSEIDV